MPNTFILNGYDGVRYTLMRYEGRDAVPPSSIVGPGNDGGAVHVAWPSAFQVNGSTRVYGSRYYNNQWRDIACWTGPKSGPFAFSGIALTANVNEPNGIGPSQVYFDAAAARPWKMVYLVRNAIGTGHRLALADSADGLAWERRGPVMTASESYEAAGFSPSHVMRDNDGTWALFYQAYQSLTQGPAAIALAPTSSGPFGNKQIIFQPTGITHAVSNGRRLTSTATVNSGGPVRVGEPYVIRLLAGGGLQVTLPTRQVGTTVYFEEFLLADYVSGVELAHIARNKIDPSYATQRPDGSWRGIFTGYGLWSDLITEYTFNVEAPQVSGPWTITPGRVSFNPWNLPTLLSAENPTPVVEIS